MRDETTAADARAEAQARAEEQAERERDEGLAMVARAEQAAEEASSAADAAATREREISDSVTFMQERLNREQQPRAGKARLQAGRGRGDPRKTDPQAAPSPVLLAGGVSAC